MESYSPDLEKSLLASLMFIEDSYLEISHTVKPEDFHANRHQVIFSAIAELSNANEPYDVLMVKDLLVSQNQLESAGGEEYLGDMLSQSPATLFNLKAYAKRIRELSAIRQAKQVLLDGQGLLDSSGEYADKVNTIVENLTAIVDEKTVMKGAETISQMMRGFFDKLQSYVHSGETPFIKTGFIELDNRVNIQAGELIIVAGRPSMGKTTLAQNILQKIVETTQGIGVFFSLEMAKDQVMQRFMSSRTGVHLFKVKSGQGLNTQDWEALSNAADNFGSNYNLFVDDRTALTASQMRSTLNKIRQKHGKISVVMVDYIQKMGGIKDGSSGERSASIFNIVSALKNFSKEYECPVIALSQLNRDNEKRPNRRPQMSDLAESKGIEQEADHIWAIHREEVSNPTKENAGKADIVILKQRQGATGTIPMNFEGHCVRFTDSIPNFNDSEMPEDFYQGGNHA